ncbi:MAG TPA: RraA family protein [Burkholderiaceae bacterium]|nr:RraA family protein [Burkholderiaceae bacterium]
MIEDPPLLTIRRTIERPERALVEAFAGTPTGFVVDAMQGRGALDSRIKPLPGMPDRFVGTALTCRNGPADNLALAAAVSLCAPGDVLVAATDGFTGCAVVGDLLLGIAKNRGACAFVTDGLVRDLTDMQALVFPAFAAGVSPNSPVRNGPGTVGLPVVCGGVPVVAGDLVIGDPDGVVIVPRGAIRAVLTQLAAVRANEAKMLTAVQGGLREPGFMTAILASDRVRYVDE